jgi:hypothetical protein
MQRPATRPSRWPDPERPPHGQGNPGKDLALVSRRAQLERNDYYNCVGGYDPPAQAATPERPRIPEPQPKRTRVGS